MKPLSKFPFDVHDSEFICTCRARLRFVEDSSDLLADVNAYNECMRLQSEGKNRTALRHFCEEV